MTAKEKKREERIEICQKAISFLNEQAGRGFGWNTPGTLEKFTADWSHKYGIKQYKGVIEYLVLLWKDDEEMDQYLRPSTIFGPKKFPEYLEAARYCIIQERKKKRFTPFEKYLPVNRASSRRLPSFDDYDPHG